MWAHESLDTVMQLYLHVFKQKISNHSEEPVSEEVRLLCW